MQQLRDSLAQSQNSLSSQEEALRGQVTQLQQEQLQLTQTNSQLGQQLESASLAIQRLEKNTNDQQLAIEAKKKETAEA